MLLHERLRWLASAKLYRVPPNHPAPAQVAPPSALAVAPPRATGGCVSRPRRRPRSRPARQTTSRRPAPRARRARSPAIACRARRRQRPKATARSTQPSAPAPPALAPARLATPLGGGCVPRSSGDCASRQPNSPTETASRRFLFRKPFDAGLTSGYCISYFHREKADMGKLRAGLAQDLRNKAGLQGRRVVCLTGSQCRGCYGPIR
jgi:hypothetical protein